MKHKAVKIGLVIISVISISFVFMVLGAYEKPETQKQVAAKIDDLVKYQTVTPFDQNIITLNAAINTTVNNIVQVTEQPKEFQLGIVVTKTDSFGKQKSDEFLTEKIIPLSFFGNDNTDYRNGDLRFVLKIKGTKNTDFSMSAKSEILMNNVTLTGKSITVESTDENLGDDGTSLIRFNTNTGFQTLEFNELLNNANQGTNQIRFILKDILIVFDGKNVKIDEKELYRLELEFDESKTIIINDEGLPVKIYNVDIPISIYGQSTPYETLLPQCYNGAFSCSPYTTIKSYPAPVIPFSTIKEKSTGNTVASGSSISANLQRDAEYIITIGTKSFEIKTPTTKTSYSYYCQHSLTFAKTAGVNNGVTSAVISCNY